MQSALGLFVLHRDRQQEQKKHFEPVAARPTFQSFVVKGLFHSTKKGSVLGPVSQDNLSSYTA